MTKLADELCAEVRAQCEAAEHFKGLWMQANDELEKVTDLYNRALNRINVLEQESHTEYRRGYDAGEQSRTSTQPTPVAYFDNTGKLQGRVSDEQLLALCSRAVIDIKMRNGWSDTEFFCTQYLSLAGGRPTLTQLPYRDWPDWADSINPGRVIG